MKHTFKRAALNIALTAVTVGAAITLGSRAPAWYAQWRAPATSGDFSVHLAGQPHKLTLYGTRTCIYCKQARTWLDANKIAYNDVLVDESAQAAERYSTLGSDGVPVLVSHSQFVVGFTESEYGKFLQANLPSLINR